MHAIVVNRTGGPEVLESADIPVPAPKAGEALVKIAAAGVNYIDTYLRSGLYPRELGFTNGQEAAGVVEAIGPDVVDVSVGQRVAYSSVLGSYADYAIVPADRLVPIPAGVDDRTACAAMLQGMTAHYLSHGTYPIQAGDTVLVHAGAGGVGLLLTQMAKARGATVITTVSTPQKAELSKKAGADHTIDYTTHDFEAEVKRITGNVGCDVVYDSVGKTTFEKSLNCLHVRGYIVLYGASSGPVPPIEPQHLSAKGSLFFTRPTLVHYIRTRADLLARAGEVFAMIADGSLEIRIGHAYALAEAAQAHRDLEGRKTTAKLLLIP
jgi:NADPH2:quinone reductase